MPIPPEEIELYFRNPSMRRHFYDSVPETPEDRRRLDAIRQEAAALAHNAFHEVARWKRNGFNSTWPTREAHRTVEVYRFHRQHLTILPLP